MLSRGLQRFGVARILEGVIRVILPEVKSTSAEMISSAWWRYAGASRSSEANAEIFADEAREPWYRNLAFNAT